jgi:hypothetical protein
MRYWKGTHLGHSINRLPLQYILKVQNNIDENYTSTHYDTFCLFHQVDQVLGDIARDAQIDHPVHQVETQEHDGEDDPAVLVDVAGAHAQHAVGGLGGRERRRDHNGNGGEGRAAATSPPERLLLLGGVAWERVVAAVERAGHHAARVEPHASLKTRDINLKGQ